MVGEKIKEIETFWRYNGGANEIEDVVSLKEMACTDIDDLIKIIKDQQKELSLWHDEFMPI